MLLEDRRESERNASNRNQGSPQTTTNAAVQSGRVQKSRRNARGTGHGARQYGQKTILDLKSITFLLLWSKLTMLYGHVEQCLRALCGVGKTVRISDARCCHCEREVRQTRGGE